MEESSIKSAAASGVTVDFSTNSRSNTAQVSIEINVRGNKNLSNDCQTVNKLWL